MGQGGILRTVGWRKVENVTAAPRSAKLAR
jgi:hypothetical protein